MATNKSNQGKRGKRGPNKETRERLYLESLGEQLRNVILSCRIYNNPFHDQPGWEELSDFSKASWTKVAACLLKANWKPPVVIQQISWVEPHNYSI